jgi:RAB protein geranylgeranyltransferase component A
MFEEARMAEYVVAAQEAFVQDMAELQQQYDQQVMGGICINNNCTVCSFLRSSHAWI